MRKFLVILCSMALVAGTIGPVGSVGSVVVAADAYDEDGDIIGNPWEKEFGTTAPEETTPEEVTTPKEEETTPEEETTVAGPIKIKNKLEDVVLAIGYNTTRTVEAEGNGTLTYQWQMSNTGDSFYNASITGATTDTATLKMTSSNNGKYVRCMVKDAEGNVAYTNVFKMIANSSAIPESSIVIIKQPEDGYAVNGIRTTFTIEAIGNIAKYQWQLSRDGGQTWTFSTSDGCRTPEFKQKVNSTSVGWLTRCVITDVNGTTTISDTAMVCMYPNTISISTQPTKVYALNGVSFTFNIEATGEELTYQWQTSKDGGVTYNNTTNAGAQTDTVTFKMAATNDGRYVRCVLSDKYGNKVYSKAVQMLMTELQITKQPTDVRTTISSETVDISVEATGDVTYQWQMSKDGGQTWSNSTATGAKTATVSVKRSASLSGNMMRCVITETSTGNKVTSNEITMIFE